MNLIKLLLEFNKISREMANKTANEDLANFLYVKLKKLVDFDAFSLGKIENETIKYVFYVEDGEMFQGIEKTIEPGKSIAYRSVTHNELIIINDYDSEFFNYVKASSRTGNTNIKYNSILVHPFEINGKVKGFFSVQNQEKNYFTAEKVILFKEVAQYIALVFDRIEKGSSFNSRKKAVNFKRSPHKNPLRDFTNSLIHKVKNIDDLVLLYCEKINTLFNVNEMDIKIYKGYSLENLKYNYKGNLTKVDEILKESKQSLNIGINDTHLGEIYFYTTEIAKLDETFEILTELFTLSLSNFLEKEELEYENAQKYQLMQALENSYKNLNTINETVKSITSTLDIKELGRRVYTGLKKIFESDCAVALAYYNEKTEELEYDILLDYGEEYDLGILKKDDTSTFAPWVIRNKKPIIVNDYEKEVHNYIDVEENQVGSTQTFSLLYLPLFRDDEIIGVFTVQKKEKNFFDNYHIELVKSIASFVNIAMINLIETRQLSLEIEEKKRYERKLEKINTKLEKISSLDSLTKLYNRRYFEKVLKEFWFRATKENRKLGFLIFDLDYFKQINDSFGHLAGDKALIEMSSIIKKYVKKDIKFGRFGGDEFVGVIFNPEKEYLIHLGKELKNALKEKAINCPPSQTKILTLTMGITLFSPSEGKDINELFLKADEALYKGKELGRNQIVFYEEGRFQCLE